MTAAARRISGDHPRTRGVYRKGLRTALRGGGSSPHARGLLLPVPAGAADCGIIPARAGFTARLKLPILLRADHPRTRGVYNTMTTPKPKQYGSSPHARGLPGSRWCSSLGLRIIPARAGFTRTILITPEGEADHPRTRGVYRPFCLVRHHIPGSSPHARGLPSRPYPCEYAKGIIPARAGFTAFLLSMRRMMADHPRTRGVYVKTWGSPYGNSGSSPHARGLLLEWLRWRDSGGIIPARAGFTAADALLIAVWPDHPRTRGVY